MAWLETLQRLADEGDPWAQFTLGLCYDNGRGVQQDFVEAAKWYRKAAHEGHTEAQYTLGVMHINGEGVAKDYVLAYMWFSLAATHGFKDAAENRDMTASFMPPDQLDLAHRLVREWNPSKER